MANQTKPAMPTVEKEQGQVTKQPAKKPKGGRPKKVIKRDAVLVVRLTQIERMLIAGRAREAGMSPSEWFRKSAKSAKVMARFSAEDAATLRMLSGMANNLNQLTKLAHQEGLVSVQDRCRELMDGIDETLKILAKE
ncbi:MAG: plasmid mobilization relaxosome protein MobC [Sphingobacteriaceae bacterium]|nr:MAG: plasmid mobilization relaxosome protein MobC [Sphingobacteriaceae bacterium]